MVVLPGGGYGFLASHEGPTVAEWLNTLGVTAFVLKYRLGPKYHHPVEMGRCAKGHPNRPAKAEEWKSTPIRIGIMGFSAGGHLTSSACTHFDDGNTSSTDPIERASCRPDLASWFILSLLLRSHSAIPVLETNLLGSSPPNELIEFLSSESKSPPKRRRASWSTRPMMPCRWKTA